MAGSAAKGSVAVALGVSVLLTLVMAREPPRAAARGARGFGAMRGGGGVAEAAAKGAGRRCTTPGANGVCPPPRPPRPHPPGRYQATRKMMPAGLTAGTSLLISAAYIGSLI
jgi:hypothetical protein